MKILKRKIITAVLAFTLTIAASAKENKNIEITVKTEVSNMNLLVNSGFELPFKAKGGWFTAKSFKKVEHITDADIAKTGKGCVKLVNFQFYRQSVELSPNFEYKLTVWAKAANSGAQIYLWAKPAVLIQGKAKKAGSIVYIKTNASQSKYGKYEFSFGSTPRNGSLPLTSTVALSAVKGSVYMDDAFLAKVSMGTSLKTKGGAVSAAALYKESPNVDTPVFKSGAISGPYEKTIVDLSTMKKYYWVLTGVNGELKRYDLKKDGVSTPKSLPADFFAAQERKRFEKENNKIVLFGDSTTAPRGPVNIYGKHLEKEFVDYTIINAGIGGNTTDMAKARFERDVLKRNPKIVVIQFGINDSCVDVWKKPPATQARVPLEKYGENIKGFIKALKKKGAQVVLMTPNPCRWTPGLKKHYNKPPYKVNDVDGWNVNLVKYARKVREIAKAENIPLVDIYAVFQDFDKKSKNKSGMGILLLDGMHPNDKGHQIISDLLIKTIHQIIKK